MNAYNGTANDAGGGGGAGGTIVVLAANGGESGLTLQANGGRGGDAWDSQPFSLADRHGPGGGGAGGVVYASGAAASISVSGGGNGTTLTPGVAYGATPGSAGLSATNATLSQVTGMQSSALCAPDLTLSKTHVGNFTRGSTASFTDSGLERQPPGRNERRRHGQRHVASRAHSDERVRNRMDLLGLSPDGQLRTRGLAGHRRQLSIDHGQCQRSQSAPATVTNTAVVGGGGEANLLNDTATDTANVVSSADMSVTDAGAPNPVAAGSNITYTQVVTNSGPSAADNATVVATIPANTTFVSFVVTGRMELPEAPRRRNRQRGL